MRKHSILLQLAGISAAMLFWASPASATCPTFHTLTNGTTANASDVMDNYNYILTCPNFSAIGVNTAAPSSGLQILNQPLVISGTGTNSGPNLTMDINPGTGVDMEPNINFTHGGSPRWEIGTNGTDLPGSFCAKRIDRNWLGKELGHGEEETDAGADSDAAAAD